MSAKLCEFFETGAAPCPCFAAEGKTLCVAHDAAENIDRVPNTKMQSLVTCSRCGLEIKKGALRRRVNFGDFVHASYQCEPKT